MSETVGIDNNRRHFMHSFTVLLGSATAAQLIDGSGLSSALAYRAKEDSTAQDAMVFKQLHMQMLKCICDLIMPKTETLSASELDVHGFVDHQLNKVYSQHQQVQAIGLLEKMTRTSQTHFKHDFHLLRSAAQVEILASIENQSMGFTEQDTTIFKLLKSLIVFGYFTTEYGATEVLKYQAIPGGYRGSIPYKSVDSSWGSLGFY
ncbi:gluconate 2-dehydrogenase subunit 3 family protein [Pseudoalteromonas aurantia]|uniref:Gluconate 2-dehydrogenase subunit 3 family protein n=1 Tax=Pseudoalteromonas aurantia 208 TaxID=1314867 RepID=A0ABR9EIJ2_9GAMM|nr:gluconate 2-dehydrogenase subunit 3 family protein [Pseudoalteromonas aurantia]MBE0370821.1 hypothetical protein [Pseudoalteromonas aurantia 208]